VRTREKGEEKNKKEIPTEGSGEGTHEDEKMTGGWGDGASWEWAELKPSEGKWSIPSECLLKPSAKRQESDSERGGGTRHAQFIKNQLKLNNNEKRNEEGKGRASLFVTTAVEKLSSFQGERLQKATRAFQEGLGQKKDRHHDKEQRTKGRGEGSSSDASPLPGAAGLETWRRVIKLMQSG